MTSRFTSQQVAQRAQQCQCPDTWRMLLPKPRWSTHLAPSEVESSLLMKILTRRSVGQSTSGSKRKREVVTLHTIGVQVLAQSVRYLPEVSPCTRSV